MNSNPLLLVVDDDPNFREIFSAQLTAAGFRVETAEDGEHGFEKAKALKPDLIISDMKMPGMPGSEMAAKLKADPDTKDIKIALLSSLATPDQQGADDQFAQWVGAVGYMSKSEDLTQIAEKIKGFLA